MNRYFEMLIHYAISGGQVPRKESRIFTLLALIAGFLMAYVAIFFGLSSYVVIIGGCGLFVLIAGIIVSVSILNDANRSGWWLLISFIPLIGSMILLGFMAQNSQSNENRGGCDPEDAAV